jgi:hypothetical protein
MDDGKGNVRTLTLFSAIRRDRLRDLKRRLAFVRYMPGLARPLLELGFVHYARWAIVDALPAADGSGGWRGLSSKHLLFQGTYDGSQRDYLDVFSEVIPARITAIWHACEGFEENVERAASSGMMIAPAAFRAFVAQQQLDDLATYAAYAASANDVRQALLMRARLETATMRLADDDAAKDIREAAAMALGPGRPREDIAVRLRDLYDPWRRAVRGDYGVRPLLLAIPLKSTIPTGSQREAARPDVAAAMTALFDGTEAHYARVSVLPSPELSIDADYLLVSFDYYGEVYPFVESLRERLAHAGVDGLGDWLVGYPGVSDEDATLFHSWISRCTLPVAYYVAGYPPRPVTEIVEAIGEREAVAAAYRTTAFPTAELIARAGNASEAAGASG